MSERRWTDDDGKKYVTVTDEDYYQRWAEEQQHRIDSDMAWAQAEYDAQADRGDEE